MTNSKLKPCCISRISALPVVFLSIILTGCADDNDAPKYSKESGLPVNCRAYIQAAVDGYKNKTYLATDAMAGIERNCGINGTSWKSNR